jgi:predicted porin
MNAYYTNTDSDTKIKVNGAKVDTNNQADANTIGTGLLPSALGISAKTRQNDLDIAFNFSFWTGTSSGNGAAAGNNTLNIRQAYLTFGDASWGSIKMGRDLGIFGSDAILSDMTLLGVGVGGPAGGNSTLGRIGSGYMYADWKGQIAYTSPNWNGFQFTAGVSEPLSNGVRGNNRNNMSMEAKASYDWTGDVAGKVWVGGIRQKHEGDNRADILTVGDNTFNKYTSRGWELGAKVATGGFGLLGYYYNGRGLDSQVGPTLGVTAATILSGAATGGLQYGAGQKTDDDGGYVQATYVIPVGTKLGLSYGRNNSDGDIGAVGKFDSTNESWIVGAYHPLTKSLNLVAEYTDQQREIKGRVGADNAKVEIENKTISLGAILFF